MYELINEPEGMLNRNAPDVVPLDTCAGSKDGPGWVDECRIPLRVLRRWVNLVAATLRTVDPNHVTTVGSWSYCASDLFGNAALREAGGRSNGVLQVRQLHAWKVMGMQRGMHHFIRRNVSFHWEFEHSSL